MSYNGGMAPTGYTPTHSVHLRRADDIAGLVKARREVLGLSQQALADRLTVSRKWVNEIEKGNSNAKLGLVLRALNELGIDLYGQPTIPAQARASPSTVHDIDIDDIADMGLLARRGRR